MIEIDFRNFTYVCPFCGHAQAYLHSYDIVENGKDANSFSVQPKYQESSFTIYTFECSNSKCGKISVTAINRTTKKQIDIVPQIVIKQYPEYIPEQIRNDYSEASQILEASPKAAATLLRRCLQGMIHDFWNIHEKNLNAEISSLNGKIPQKQWKAIDGLRQIGNIGAHMEQDVNTIIDIEPNEAKMLLKLIELLFDKWYIASHEEEELMNSISDLAKEKTQARGSL